MGVLSSGDKRILVLRFLSGTWGFLLCVVTAIMRACYESIGPTILEDAVEFHKRSAHVSCVFRGRVKEGLGSLEVVIGYRGNEILYFIYVY